MDLRDGEESDLMDINWEEVTDLLEKLYEASSGLEALFPGRKFTLDGHLVGSIGEVVAAYMFGLELMPASNLGYDALSADGRKVEIKLTQGTVIGIRHQAEHIIVLHRSRGGPIRVAYNGPGEPIWSAAGSMQRNGARQISVRKLARLDESLPEARKLPILQQAPV
ncbi:DUF6998 domain-containing protein [Fodinicurvata fenggangensis]|uniref:DUF6998 domain-containing protein n=1 Tax=Fodinicurvata fenggangensis TaxID=1121830 RepID=UPI001B805D3E|nr:hypothetical protein [Fodinicurvata fenggangensis]